MAINKRQPDFLDDRLPREWSLPKGAPREFEPAGAWSGRDSRFPLEVAVAIAGHRPRADDVRKLWRARHGNVPNPFLLIVAYPDGDGWKALICGPAGDEPPVKGNLDIGQLDRLADKALNEPTRHAAIRFLSAMWAELETELPGLRNAGMLASHELRDGVPLRADWASLCDRGRPLLDHSGRELVQQLGFTIEPGPTSASVLEIAETKRAVAVFLDEGEEFEQSGDRFGATSPVSYALALADREGLPWTDHGSEPARKEHSRNRRSAGPQDRGRWSTASDRRANGQTDNQGDGSPDAHGEPQQHQLRRQQSCPAAAALLTGARSSTTQEGGSAQRRALLRSDSALSCLIQTTLGVRGSSAARLTNHAGCRSSSLAADLSSSPFALEAFG
jgi:hypothetical protein